MELSHNFGKHYIWLSTEEQEILSTITVPIVEQHKTKPFYDLLLNASTQQLKFISYDDYVLLSKSLKKYNGIVLEKVLCNECDLKQHRDEEY